MYSNTVLRLEVSGINHNKTITIPEDVSTKQPKGKPVLSTLQYIIRIIFNYIKNTRNHI